MKNIWSWMRNNKALSFLFVAEILAFFILIGVALYPNVQSFLSPKTAKSIYPIMVVTDPDCENLVNNVLLDFKKTGEAQTRDFKLIATSKNAGISEYLKYKEALFVFCTDPDSEDIQQLTLQHYILERDTLFTGAVGTPILITYLPERKGNEIKFVEYVKISHPRSKIPGKKQGRLS